MNTPQETETTPEEAAADPVVDAAELLPTGTVEPAPVEIDPADLAPEEAAELLPTGTVIEEAVVEEPAPEEIVDGLVYDKPEGEETAPKAQSPYDLSGRWYVIHTQSGYENKVRKNLEARVASMNLEESILDIVIPMEDVVEFRNGKKVTVSKKMFPGYLLVRCWLNDQSWNAIRETPGIVNFVGAAGKPSSLKRKEVEAFLWSDDDASSDAPKKVRAKLGFGIGETVRVKGGPFADFSGEVIEINEEQLKVKVVVDIFGRETPVELEFSQVAQL